MTRSGAARLRRGLGTAFLMALLAARPSVAREPAEGLPGAMVTGLTVRGAPSEADPNLYRVDQSVELTVLAPGQWNEVSIFDRAADLVKAELDDGAATLRSGAEGLVLYVPPGTAGAGHRRTLAIQVLVPVVAEGDRRTLHIPLPATPGGTFALRLPEPAAGLRVEAGVVERGQLPGVAEVGGDALAGGGQGGRSPLSGPPAGSPEPPVAAAGAGEDAATAASAAGPLASGTAPASAVGEAAPEASPELPAAGESEATPPESTSTAGLVVQAPEISGRLGPGRLLRVTWLPLAALDRRAAPKMGVESSTLVTLSRSHLTGTSVLRYAITRGVVTRLRLQYPASLRLHAPVGERVATWREVPDPGGRLRNLLVLLERPVVDTYELRLSFDADVPVDSERVEIPLVRPLDVEGAGELVGIAAAGPPPLRPAAAAGVRLVQGPGRLAERFSLTEAPLYVVEVIGSDAALSFERAPAGSPAVIEALATQVELNTAVTADGLAMNRLSLAVSPAARRFLTIELGGGADLRALSEDGTTIAAPRSAAGGILVPLTPKDPRTGPVKVEVIFLERRGPVDGFGWQDFHFPRLDLDAADVAWEVTLPAAVAWRGVAGDFSELPLLGEGAPNRRTLTRALIAANQDARLRVSYLPAGLGHYGGVLVFVLAVSLPVLAMVAFGAEPAQPRLTRVLLVLVAGLALVALMAVVGRGALAAAAGLLLGLALVAAGKLVARAAAGRQPPSVVHGRT